MEPCPDDQPQGPGAKGAQKQGTAAKPDQTKIERKGMEQELYQKVVEIVARISGTELSLITPEAKLIEDIGIDSLGFYEILIEVDEHLNIRIKEEDLLKFRTVMDVEIYLRQRFNPNA